MKKPNAVQMINKWKIKNQKRKIDFFLSFTIVVEEDIP